MEEHRIDQNTCWIDRDACRIDNEARQIDHNARQIKRATLIQDYSHNAIILSDSV